MEQIVADSGWRGSREVWLQAAFEVLLDTGVDAVRILPIANKLGLSRTSFYWFFKDRDELLGALLTKWKETNTANLLARIDSYAENIAEAMLNVSDCWLNADLFDSQFEFAVRSWGLQSPMALAAVQEADRIRIDAFKAMFRRFGYDEAAADVRARTTYLVQIGYISMQTKEALETRMRRLPYYIEIFTDLAPSESDMKRFAHRHGYRGKIIGVKR